MRFIYDLIRYIIEAIKEFGKLFKSPKHISRKDLKALQKPLPGKDGKCLNDYIDKWFEKKDKTKSRLSKNVSDPEKGLRYFWRSHDKISILDNADKMAFNIVLAIVPSVIFMLAIFDFQHINGLKDLIFTNLSRLFPDINDSINGFIVVLQDSARMIKEKNVNKKLAVKIISAIVALWSGSVAIRSILGSFNLSFDNKPGFFRRSAIGILLTIVVYAMVLVCVLAIMFTCNMFQDMFDGIHNETLKSLFGFPSARIISALIAMLFMCGTVVILYRHGNKGMKKFKYIIPGLKLFVILSVAGTLLFYAFYRCLSDYTFYGFLGIFAIVLFWIETICYFLFLGNEYNSFLGKDAEMKSTELTEDESLFIKIYKSFFNDAVISDDEKNSLEELRIRFDISPERMDFLMGNGYLGNKAIAAKEQ